MPKIVINCTPNLRPKIELDRRYKPLKKTIRRAAKAALADFDLPKKAEVAILIVGDEEGRRLNQHYRNREHATNVLSFAMEDGDAPPQTAKGCRLLGDIVLSYETINKEALDRHIPMEEHLTHLVIHGVLHLLGYDHERSAKEAQRQEKRETAILAGLGIANPYE